MYEQEPLVSIPLSAMNDWLELAADLYRPQWEDDQRLKAEARLKEAEMADQENASPAQEREVRQVTLGGLLGLVRSPGRWRSTRSRTTRAMQQSSN